MHKEVNDGYLRESGIMAAMKTSAFILSVLLLAAPASAAFLDANTRPAEKPLPTASMALAGDVTADLLPDSRGSCLVEGPKPREISYIRTGTYKVQEYITKLKIVYQGKTAWEISATNIPPMLHLKNGQNLTEAIQEVGRQPSYDFFERVVLPDFLQKPSENQKAGSEQTLGTSLVTPQGFRSL